MDFLPKELEDIIIDYKEDLDYQEIVKQHNKKFRKSLTIIKKIRNRSCGFGGDRTERTITIGPFTHSKIKYTYCFCFRICLECNNIRQSSRVYRNKIGNPCNCNYH